MRPAGVRAHRPPLPGEAAGGALPVRARPGVRAEVGNGIVRGWRAFHVTESACGARCAAPSVPGLDSRSARARCDRARCWQAARVARVATAPPASVFTRFDKVTDEPGVEATPALSPGRRAVVYAKAVGTDTALYLLRVGSRHAQRLSGAPPARDLQPAFSPDGERIAFRSDRDGGGVFLMTASGESVTRLTDVGYLPSLVPDGTEIVVSTGTSVRQPTCRQRRGGSRS